MGVKRFDANGELHRRVPHRRPVHLHRLYALDAVDPVSAPQGRCGAEARRLRSRRAFRQGTGQRAGELSARRAVPDRRGHALSVCRWRCCSSTSGRACACCRGSTASTASSRCWSTCRASVSTRSVRKAIGDYLADAYKGRVSAFYPFFPEGPLVRVHFIIGSAPGEAAASQTAPASSARSRRSCEPGPTSSPTRSTQAHEPGRARGLFERYRDAFSQGYRENYSPAHSGRRHPHDRGVVAQPSARCRLSPPPRRSTAAAVGLKVWSYNRPIPLSERVPVLENMGFKVVDERTYRIAPRRTRECGWQGRATRLVARHAARARRRPRGRSRRHQAQVWKRPSSW